MSKKKYTRIAVDSKGKQIEDKSRIGLSLISLLLALTLVGLIIIVALDGYNRTNILSTASEYLDSVIEEKAMSFEREMDEYKKMLNVYSDKVSALFENGEPGIDDILDELSEVVGFERICFVSAAGINYSKAGSADISERPYYLRGMRGESGIAWISESQITGDKSVAVFVPVKVDGKPVGVLLGHISLETIKRIIHYDFIDMTVHTVLLNESGQIVAYSDNPSEAQKEMDSLNPALQSLNYERGYSYSRYGDFLFDKSMNKLELRYHDTSGVGIIRFERMPYFGWVIMSVFSPEIRERVGGPVGRVNNIMVVIMVVSLGAAYILFGIMKYRHGVNLRKTVQLAVASKSEENAILEKNLVVEKKYREALLSGAIVDYRFSVTKNLLIDSPYVILDGEKIDTLKLLGLKLPYSYSEFIKKWGQTLRNKDDMMSFIEAHDREMLIRQYMEGNRELTTEVSVDFDETNGRIYMRQIMLLYETDERELICHVIAKKINKEREEYLRSADRLEELNSKNYSNSVFAMSAGSNKNEFLVSAKEELFLPIKNNTDLIDKVLDRATSRDEQKPLKAIRNNCEKIESIFNDIIDFSNYQYGDLELEEKEYNPLEEINSMTPELWNLIDSPEVELIYDITPSLPKLLVGDGKRIRQIIKSLVTYAAANTKKGRIVLAIRNSVLDEHSVAVDMSLFYTGKALSDKQIANMFVYGQEKNIRDNNISIVMTKILANILGGDISVSNYDDSGVIFRISLRQKFADADRAASIQPKAKHKVIGYYSKIDYVGEYVRKLADGYGITAINLVQTPEVDVSMVFVDGNTYLRNREEIRKNYSKSVPVFVLVRPENEKIKGKNVYSLEKPLYTENFCKCVNDEIDLEAL